MKGKRRPRKIIEKENFKIYRFKKVLWHSIGIK